MEILGIFSAFGLSASAGLNAYIPLLAIALLAKFTDLIQLSQPWDTLTSWWIIGLILILAVVEFFADKVPAVNHVNDIIQTIVRPVAGAIVFAASAHVITEIHPVLSIAAGLLVAGGSACGEIPGCPTYGNRYNRRGRQRTGKHPGRFYFFFDLSAISDRTSGDCSNHYPFDLMGGFRTSAPSSEG